MDDVPDDYHAMPYDIVFDADLYKASNEYRDEITKRIIKFEDDLLRWWNTIGYKLSINERKTAYGLLDVPGRKDTQVIKRFKKDGYYNRHLLRCERLRGEYYAMQRYFATI